MTAKLFDLTTGHQIPNNKDEAVLSNYHANALIAANSYSQMANDIRFGTVITGNLAVDSAAHRLITACEGAAMLFESAAVAIQELREAS